jgi:hypothetical protein
LKQCTNCRGSLADFVAICPYCGVSQPVPQLAMAQPAWGAPPQNSNKAIASLVCGVLLCFGLFTNIPAIILGHLALTDIKRSGGRMAGKGLAIAGLVTGYIGIALSTAYLIFIVFAVRSTMGRGIPTNEAAAITSMRAYDQALKSYAEKCPQQGYPATLIPLGPGAGDCKHSNLVDVRLAASVPVRQGYLYQYSTGVTGPEKITAFALVARPVTPGMSGTRFFYLDESGVIRESATQNIGPNSKPLGGTEASADGEDDEKSKEEAEANAEERKALPANEAAAISSMQIYRDVLQKYAKKCPQQGYPADLSPLGPGTGDCKHANLIDIRMAGQDPVRQGYKFVYSTGATGPEKVSVFALVARPEMPGLTGKRYFYLDESGVIRESPNQIIGPNSEPLSNHER